MNGRSGNFAVAGIVWAQALVEYGALNSLMRDASMAMQRLGGWAARNWILVAIVLGGLLILALKPRR